MRLVRRQLSSRASHDSPAWLAFLDSPMTRNDVLIHLMDQPDFFRLMDDRQYLAAQIAAARQHHATAKNTDTE